MHGPAAALIGAEQLVVTAMDHQAAEGAAGDSAAENILAIPPAGSTAGRVSRLMEQLRQRRFLY